jgi:hypothetical protein
VLHDSERPPHRPPNWLMAMKCRRRLIHIAILNSLCTHTGLVTLLYQHEDRRRDTLSPLTTSFLTTIWPLSCSFEHLTIASCESDATDVWYRPLKDFGSCVKDPIGTLPLRCRVAEGLYALLPVEEPFLLRWVAARLEIRVLKAGRQPTTTAGKCQHQRKIMGKAAR